MLPPARIRYIHVAMHRVDFRKGHDGLLAECYGMELDPFAGDVVLFISRCRRRMKLLFADDSGLWIAFKRFNRESMKTKFRFLADPFCMRLQGKSLDPLIPSGRKIPSEGIGIRPDLNLASLDRGCRNACPTFHQFLFNVRSLGRSKGLLRLVRSHEGL